MMFQFKLSFSPNCRKTRESKALPFVDFRAVLLRYWCGTRPMSLIVNIFSSQHNLSLRGYCLAPYSNQSKNKNVQLVLKRPSHVKLMLANLCWQSQIGLCERHNNMLTNCWQKTELVSILANFSPTVCQHVVMSFTHTNLNLPTRVGQH